ncbi:hypothetical protein [Streptomyces sp. NPDC048438]|uniref:hypothetical protein n=1 Tax=Streptomyces sp. NPDC048438 TaxID=3365551 RepID=UPI00370F9E3F
MSNISLNGAGASCVAPLVAVTRSVATLKTLTELQEKTRQGIPAASSTMAFGEYLTYWLAAVAPERLKPATHDSGRVDVTR